MQRVAPSLIDGQKELILITHDESSIWHSNETPKNVRLLEDGQHLIPKGMGRGLMVSQFMCECHGIIRDEHETSTEIVK